ncbi:MAG: hypothetical protein IID35_02600 [Planctomycetes bacterium]|nr:hypothetical protein [Planctomycetota bacterium]
MINADHTRRGSRCLHPAFSLVETALSILLVGGLVVAALNTVGASVAGREFTRNRGRGDLLAHHLMSEILRQSYQEPVDTPTMGRESGESGGSRSSYDDVDDYDGWASSPPEEKNGSALADLTGWERSVVVEFVDPNVLTTVSATETGVKRITVTVRHHGVDKASLTSIKTIASE